MSGAKAKYIHNEQGRGSVCQGEEEICLDFKRESLQDMETSWLREDSKIIVFAAL